MAPGGYELRFCSFFVRDDSEFTGESFDACRIFGGIDVNKVAGNFHITAGK